MNSRAEMGDAAWEDTITVGFTRNPWDRAVSLCAFLYARHGRARLLSRATFHQWLWGGMRNPRGLVPWLDERTRLAATSPASRFLCDTKGRQLVKMLGRYEHLATDVRTVQRLLGEPERALPSIRDGLYRNDYRSYYDRQSAERVGDLYADDVRAFAYTFDNGVHL